MGKYYYVCIMNAYEKEIRDALSDTIVTKSLGYSEPSATFLKNIKGVMRTKEEKFLGIRYKSEYPALDDFPLICEMEDSEHFTEVITGRKYIRYYSERKYKPSSTILLHPVQEIPSSGVIKMLRSLTEEDLKRYRIGMQNFDYNMKKGYNNYLKRVADDQRQSKQDDEFIKTFRDRHGKR